MIFTSKLPPEKALEIAYQTLLTFDIPKDVQDKTFVNTNVMCAFAIVKNPEGVIENAIMKSRIACLITIETMSNLYSKITLVADHGGASRGTGKGDEICFIAEFIKRFIKQSS